MIVPLQLRVAAVLLWISGIGFGIFCIPAIRNLLTGRDIPYVMGFPAYGRGPFERVSLQTTVPLLTAFLIVCILEVGVSHNFGQPDLVVTEATAFPDGPPCPRL
jgi:hypothetical protein